MINYLEYNSDQYLSFILGFMHITQFAERLALATTERGASAILRDYLNHLDIQSYAFTYYSGHIKTGRKLKYHCVSTALRPWHTHYLEQGYANVDRTLEESHTATLPIFWDVHAQLRQAKNNRELRVRKESIEYGLDKGLSIPVYGPNKDFVTLTLHQRRNENCLQHYIKHQFEWLSAAQIFYHYINKILRLQDVPLLPTQLTKREEQCLSLTAQGWRVEKISSELKISPRTVNFHLQNANKKLGTNNKYQAVNLYY
jgi:DNA-binding CsgD family transcriptional regulator